MRQWKVNPERVAFIHGCDENSINQRPPFLDNETCPNAASRRLGLSRILAWPLSERQHNVWMAAAIFSFSLHPLAKKISAKKLSHPA
jgi:hypothetical protein